MAATPGSVRSPHSIQVPTNMSVFTVPGCGSGSAMLPVKRLSPATMPSAAVRDPPMIDRVEIVGDGEVVGERREDQRIAGAHVVEGHVLAAVGGRLPGGLLSVVAMKG